jgi:hypothetical protein
MPTTATPRVSARAAFGRQQGAVPRRPPPIATRPPAPPIAIDEQPDDAEGLAAGLEQCVLTRTESRIGDIEDGPPPALAGWHPTYAALAASLPPSVRAQQMDRLSRKKYGLDTLDDEAAITLALEKAVASYGRKREAGRVRAAAKRAEARAAKAAVAEPEPEAAPEAE